VADKHSGTLLAAGTLMAAVGGVFMGVTALEPTKTPQPVWASDWFVTGFAFVILGLLTGGGGVYLNFRRAGPMTPRLRRGKRRWPARRRAVDPAEREATSHESVSVRSPKYDAFLSYEHTDRPLVARVSNSLKSLGLRIYSDLELHPGDNWQENLPSALLNSHAGCFFIGAETPSSRSVQLEIGAASAKGLKLVPVLLPGADLDSMPPVLAACQWVDLRDGLSDTAIQGLANSLKSTR